MNIITNNVKRYANQCVVERLIEQAARQSVSIVMGKVDFDRGIQAAYDRRDAAGKKSAAGAA